MMSDIASTRIIAVFSSISKITFKSIGANKRKRRKKYRKRYWVHPLNLQRLTNGEHLKVEQMYLNFPEKFVEYTRLTCAQFDKLLNLLSPKITKVDTNYRKAISPRIRLFLTLRYLATGDSLKSISTSYSIGFSTLWNIIGETMTAIWEILAPIYLKPPNSSEWKIIMDDFYSKWDFPNCLGAIDGKHVQIEAPELTGSMYHNYKGFFSIVLMATCDANYKFTTVDIGAYGRQSDGGVFNRSALGKSLKKGTFPFPTSTDIAESPYCHPCVFVGDEAFSLSTCMMRPYPGKFLPNDQRIFNYRLSRARRVIENTFGVLCSRFRVFRRPILAEPARAELIVKAAIALHNYLRTEEEDLDYREQYYCPPGFVDENDEPNGAWRNVNPERCALEQLARAGSNMHSRIAKQMRENLKKYFSNEGQVHWQNERAGIGTK